MAQWVRSLDLRTKLQTWCTLLAAAIDKVYQLLAHSRWFSQGTLASSITQTGCHDIAEILLKVTIITKNQSINYIMKLRFNSAKLAIVFVCLQFLPCIFVVVDRRILPVPRSSSSTSSSASATSTSSSSPPPSGTYSSPESAAYYITVFFHSSVSTQPTAHLFSSRHGMMPGQHLPLRLCSPG